MSSARPTDIRLHRTSRVLEVAFDDGVRHALPCELLRVYSPSAEVKGHGPGQRVLQTGKANVNIIGIEPVGNYAVLLRFDDGHQTGIYSWDTLRDLGDHHDRYWQQYLEELEAAGASREARS